jgi:hypothetical protein
MPICQVNVDHAGEQPSSYMGSICSKHIRLATPRRSWVRPGSIAPHFANTLCTTRWVLDAGWRQVSDFTHRLFLPMADRPTVPYCGTVLR